MTPLEKLFSSIPNLPSMPRVVQEMIASLNNEDVDVGTLIRQVSQDQSLSARVLRLANSSYYGASHKVGAIDGAVTLIGLNALRTLVIASGVSGAFAHVEGVNLKTFWHHAMVSANAGRLLAKRARQDAEIAYTSALMHRLGEIMIHIAYPEAGKRIAQRSAGLDSAALASLEREEIGVSHNEAGAELARRWNFPAVIQNALRWYTEPLNETACPQAAVVALASQIASGIDQDLDGETVLSQLPAVLLDSLSLPHDEMLDLIDDLADAVADAEQFI